MKLNKKTLAAIKDKRAAAKGKKAKLVTREAKVKEKAVNSHQWKEAKKLGLDKLMGHGGLYNLRKSDITGALISEGKVSGSRQVAIFGGTQGVCFLDGNANGKRVFGFGGYAIDLGKVKRVLFFGSLSGAIAFVRKHGKANAGETQKGEAFTHIYGIADGHYNVATDGRRLLRTEERKTTDGSKKFTYSFGK